MAIDGQISSKKYPWLDSVTVQELVRQHRIAEGKNSVAAASPPFPSLAWLGLKGKGKGELTPFSRGYARERSSSFRIVTDRLVKPGELSLSLPGNRVRKSSRILMLPISLRAEL